MPSEIVAFFQDLHQLSQAGPEQLVLFGHYLCIITTSNSKKSHIDPRMAIKRHNSALKTEPERESRKHLKKNRSKRPDVKDKAHLGKIGYSDICLVSETFREERVNFGWQILWGRLDKLALVSECFPLLIQKEGRAQIDNLEGPDRLRTLVVVNYDVVWLQIPVNY